MANEIKAEPTANLGKSLKRSNKPMMERRRRERINNSLEMLKKLVLESLKKDTSQYSKLEKADILEMTVKHLRSVQCQQLALAAAADSTVVGKYRAGFSECAQEVTRYLSQVEGLNHETRAKLELHLQGCIHRGPPVTETPQTQPQNYAHPANQQLHVGIPAATPMTSLPGAAPQTVQQIPVLNAQGVPQFFGAIQVVPGNVIGTDVTLLLPTSQMCSNMTSSPPSNYQAGSASVSPSSNRSSPSSSVSRESSSTPCTPSPSSHHQMVSPASHHVASHHMTSSKSWPQMAPVQNMPVNVQFKEERVWRPW